MNTYTQQYLVNTIYGDSRTSIAVLQLKILTVQYLLYDILFAWTHIHTTIFSQYNMVTVEPVFCSIATENIIESTVLVYVIKYLINAHKRIVDSVLMPYLVSTSVVTVKIH